MSVGGLTLIGIGGIIGAGFFLGSGLPIRTAGPAVLLAFLLGGLITAQVTGALTSMAVEQPVKGGIQVFPQMYLGSFAGYLQGWTYYLSSILTISSEAVAMAIFTQMWWPRVPTLLLAWIFSALIIAINAFGVKGFQRIESIMSVVKIGALVGFIVYGGILLFAAVGHHSIDLGSEMILNHAGAKGGFLPNGWISIPQSMLIVIFSFAGIGVFAAAAAEIRHPNGIETAAIWTLSMLTCLYLASIALVLWLVPWSSISTSASPFVTAIQASGLRILSVVLNGVILIAAFSVMAGALYSANQIIFVLAQNGNAPKQVTIQSRTGTPWVGLIVSTILITVFLVCSIVLPANIYDFLISASSYFIFLNYFIILWAFLYWRRKPSEDNKFISKLAIGQPVSTLVTMIVLIGLVIFSLFQHDQRMGFYASVLLSLFLSIVYFIFVHHRVRR
ncbi:Aromatic amino acid transport protein AroP [Paenibacillus allorhizoplanae]|uniref:Aromatic amino acid transport protein AroP n=1 Tax=Paenibacillus allorhizoplanae TaxID=2905648 RepID=A0ABN8H3R3_9BACL|nr:Aromatic amino acid transport protein AroP [Paenibacillus allorhizoplanae]